MAQAQPWYKITALCPALNSTLGLLPSLLHCVVRDEIQTKQNKKLLTSALPGHCHGSMLFISHRWGKPTGTGVTWEITSGPAVTLAFINLCFPACLVTNVPSGRLEEVPTPYSPHPPVFWPYIISHLAFHSLCLLTQLL